MNTKTKPKFQLGRIVATPGALEALERTNEQADAYLRRHASGDWGIVCSEDGALNDQAVVDGSRIMSAYLLPDETKLWVITEATVDESGNRPATTLLLPEEY